MEAFHNTTNLTGSALDFARAKAESQNEKILKFMKSERKAFSPDEVWMKTGMQDKNAPLTSVRRAMTDFSHTCRHCLTRWVKGKPIENLCCFSGEGILTKLKEQRKGTYGSRVGVWMYTEFIQKP